MAAHPTSRAEAKADGDAKPKETDFKDYPEYIEALSKWTYRQERKAETEAAERTKQETSKKELDEAHNARSAKFIYRKSSSQTPSRPMRGFVPNVRYKSIA